LVFALIAAVYAFQRRAFIDITIAQNRLAASEADALARGGIRIAEAIVYLEHLKQAASELDAAGGAEGAGGPASGLGQALLPAGDLWERVGDFLVVSARSASIEDEGVRLNLNASCRPACEEGQEEAQTALAEEDEGESLDDAEQYLIAVLEYIIDGMEGAREEKRYDAIAIARNLIDWMDADSTARDGPTKMPTTRTMVIARATAPSSPSRDQRVGVDGRLLEAMRVAHGAIGGGKRAST
jgi:hypothetical protein